MSFGRNPYVAKARAAEQKAAEAHDDIARTRAHREAAHEWDRAAARERPGKQRTEFEASAAANRSLADGVAGDGVGDKDGEVPSAPIDPALLN
jgi:hypothetical protein